MMKYIAGLLFVALLSLLMSHRLCSQEKPENLFYYVDNEECFSDFVGHAGRISIVAPGWFSVDDDGVVWGDVDQRVIDVAQKHAIGVMPLIVNPGFNQSMLHRLLDNGGSRSRAIATMVELCRQHGFLGIQFDFENLHIDDRDAFSRFYRETAEALHKQGFKLSVAVVHRMEDYAGPTPYHMWLFRNWRAGYDLGELAKAGDFISVMTYSQHTRRTTPGPNAGIPWMKQIVEYFLKFMPTEKLSLGIPLESQHWYTALDTAGFASKAHSWNRSLDYMSAAGLADRFHAKREWNAEQNVSYAVFENEGLFEYIYFEDLKSFKAKYELIKTYRLRGFSAWVLGAEDPQVWDILPSESH